VARLLLPLRATFVDDATKHLNFDSKASIGTVGTVNVNTENLYGRE
jgi:hypothetical protein